MSRSGYSDDCEYLDLWRGSVDRAIHGARGQHFLRKLRDALDALPVKRLIAGQFSNAEGDVCALGAIDPKCPVDPDDRDQVGAHFGIAPAMAAEIVYENDEYPAWRHETPEARWTRMRAWVESQIVPESPPSADAVDPHVGSTGTPTPRDNT